MVEKITLAVWDGDPMALVQNEAEGTAEGYAYIGDQWKPGFAEEAMTKATVLDEETFKKVFPNVPPFTSLARS